MVDLYGEEERKGAAASSPKSEGKHDRKHVETFDTFSFLLYVDGKQIYWVMSTRTIPQCGMNDCPRIRAIHLFTFIDQHFFLVYMCPYTLFFLRSLLEFGSQHLSRVIFTRFYNATNEFPFYSHCNYALSVISFYVLLPEMTWCCCCRDFRRIL